MSSCNLSRGLPWLEAAAGAGALAVLEFVDELLAPELPEDAAPCSAAAAGSGCVKMSSSKRT